MKGVISSVIFFLILSNVFAQDDFIISGLVNKEYNGASINFNNDSYRPNGFQTTKVVNGQFVIRGTLKNINDKCSISITKNGKVNYLNFFVSKGKLILKIKKLHPNNINNNIEYINFPGIKENEEYSNLILPYKTKSRETFILLEERQKLKSDLKTIDSLERKVREWHLMSTMESIRFIKKYKNSYLAFYYFKEDVLPKSIHPDSLAHIFSLFEAPLRNSEEGKIISRIIERKQSIVLGNFLPDFQFLTDDSILYKLSDFRDKKMVLVCMWASWCGPCIQGFPIFKNINDSFSNNLQLISISFDDEIEHWRMALKKYSLPWLQTNYLPQFIPTGNIRDLYDLRFIPQYFLLDKNGRIIYHSVQNKDDGSYSILTRILREQFKTE